MRFFSDGMNIEIREVLYIFREMIEEDTIILSENLEEVNQYFYDI